MSDKIIESKIENPNKYKVGPGLGLIIMGAAYLIWWIVLREYAIKDPRWVHNYAYAIIILNIGLAWYQKSVVSRTVAAVQSFMMPVTASGSFNSLTMTLITIVIFLIWILIVSIEHIRGKMFFKDSLKKRTWSWINMHSVVVSWILIAHMGLVFLIGRVPLEAQLEALGSNAGFLANLPPERNAYATWFFDITLIVWAVIVLYEQFKMGYNVQNKPWPKTSFYMCFICMLAGLIGIGVSELLSLL